MSTAQRGRARRAVGAALLAVALAAVAAGCGSDGGSSQGASGDSVKFGFLNGQTGDYGPWGDWARGASEVAMDEINDAGGVLDRKAELVVEDNQSTPEGAVSGFSKLTEVDNIDVLSGIESDGMKAIFESVEEQQIPTICDTCGTTELDKTGGKYVFRIISSDSDSGVVVAQVAKDEGAKKAALLVEQSEGTTSPADAFKEVFTKKVGGEITDDVRFDAGRSTYSTELEEALSGNPDVIYVSTGFETGVPLLKEWVRRGAPGKLLLSTDLIHDDIAKIVEGKDVQAVLSTYDEQSPAWPAYSKAFKKKTGDASQVGSYDAWRHDAYIILALAIQAAGTTDGAKVAKQVLKVSTGPGVEVNTYAEGLAELEKGNDINYSGITGNLDLNEFGSLSSPLQSALTPKGGTWVSGKTFEVDPDLRP